MAGNGRETWQWERGARGSLCVTADSSARLCRTLRDTHRARCWRCGGLRAGARVADLLVAAWLMATVAAGMIEAKKMQRMVQLLLLCAEGSQELNCGYWCGVERAARVAERVCDGQS
jgi:hypothetical protein